MLVDMDSVYAALADPNRRLLLDRLRDEGLLSLSALAGPLAMSRQAVTEHLDVLERAGLVVVHRGSRSVCTSSWRTRCARSTAGLRLMKDGIERTLTFEASPERVWKAITDPAELAQWFGESAELELKVGGEGFMAWEEHGRFPMLVTEYEPLRRIAWRWGRERDELTEDCISTLVELTLTPRKGGGTTFYRRETGFQSEERRQENIGGWKHKLGEFASLIGVPELEPTEA